MHMDVITDAGAYAPHGSAITLNMGAVLSLYAKKCENLKFTAKVVYTNKPICGAFRGYGITMGGFALECAMDELAEVLKMDPLELRLKNAVEEGQTDLFLKASGKHEVFRSCGLIKTLEKGREIFEWDRKMKQLKKENEGKTKKRGIGLACSKHKSGVLGRALESAQVKLNEDGTILVTIGASEMGQGLESALSQIAAETVGVRLDDVFVVSCDTERTFFSMGTYGASGTYVAGNAVKRAAEELKEKIILRAAKLMNKSPQDLETGDGKIYVKGNPNESMTIKELAMDAFYGRDLATLEGFGYAKSVPSPSPFTTHFVEVEVDEESGEVKVLRYLALADVGTPINPKQVEGQIEGAVAMGIGYALLEEMEFDEKGRLKNPNLGKYKIPTSLQVPDIETVIVESYEPTGPYGAKSVGEVCMVPPAPAIANAIYNAIGVRIRDLPITKEKLLEALRYKRDEK
jgi:CO/xanthine dehydrogenase Mo-binding subunit